MATNAKHLNVVVFTAWALSCPVFAQTGKFAGGTGRPDNPYRIATAAQLASITATMSWPSHHFLLINDLDLDPNLPGGRVFEGAVIASGVHPYREPFAGTFNGSGHTIRNLVIRAKAPISLGLAWAGLFGNIARGAIVSNLKIEVADVQALDRRTGILAGESAGRIINCQVSGRLSTSGSRATLSLDEAGGLVGRNTGDIVNCRTDTDLVQGDGCAGGLVGTNFPEGCLANCRAVCPDVCARRFNGGGLVGVNSGCVIGSAALGGILAPDSSQAHGGLAGANRGTIVNCRAHSDIAAGARCWKIGGLVGENQGTIINCSAGGSISTQDRCSLVGGLVGWNLFSHARVVNSYAAGRISPGTNNSDVRGLVGGNHGGDVTRSFWDREISGTAASGCGTGLTTAQMQQATTFLDAGWDFVNERANGITDAWRMPEGGGYPVLTLGFDGYNPPGLTGQGTAEVPYLITTPEDLGFLWRHDPTACYQLGANLDLAGLRWTGAPVVAFNGIFDGGGFVISHLTLHERAMAGLFSALGREAIVMDLGIADANILAGDGAENVGLLAGRNYGGEVFRCYATGRLAAGPRSLALGGLIGHNSGPVTNCYARTTVSCGAKSSRLGGLVGTNGGTLKHSYATGAVATPDPNGTCGGLLGAPEKTTFLGMITNCYFRSPSEDSGPNNALGTTLTDTRMKQQASFTYWDFKQTWAICAGKDYPRLRWEEIDCDQP